MNGNQPRLSRREFAVAATLAAAGLSAFASAAHAQDRPAPGGQAGRSATMDALPRLTVGLVIFPQMTAMVMVAPQLCTKLMMKTDTHIVAQTAAPVTTDGSYEIVPTMTFADCPKDFDVLFVPRGTELALRNDALLDFVADRGSRARYVTSVCTGSMILSSTPCRHRLRSVAEKVAKGQKSAVSAPSTDKGGVGRRVATPSVS